MYPAMAKVVEKKMIEIGRIAYNVNGILGQGGFAYVYSGTLRGENGERIGVAVKRILNGNVNTDKREVEALKKLKGHPNIVDLFGAEKDENFNFFALERCAASMDQMFLPDDDPKKYQGPLPYDLDVLLQLSKGLQYIHENGFVHRDIKPDNVLISYPSKDDGKVVMKWSDFGFSKPVSSRGTFSISGVRGTFNWIAPEILAILDEDPSVKTRKGTAVESDTWSFGCVIFAYLTKGKHPFAGGNGIFQNILNSTPINLPTALPQDHFAFNIIKEMIQKEPKNRIKLSDVVDLLNKEKTQREQGDNATCEDVAIEGFPPEDGTIVLPINKLNRPEETSEMNPVEETQKSPQPIPGTFQMLHGHLIGIPVVVKRVNLMGYIDEIYESRVKIMMDLAKKDSIVRLLYYEDHPDGFRTYAFERSEGSVHQLFLPDDDERTYRVGIHPLPSPANAVLQLAKGLAFIHSKGTFHGDIKPQNVLLSLHKKRERIDLKWADFGFSTNIDITQEKDEFGLSGIRKTYAWQSAEIIEEYNKVVEDSWQETSESYISYMKKLFEHRPGSVAADLFSAGCFFFYFLTKGVHPFGQSTEIPTNIVDDHPENFSKMPASHYAYKALLKMIHHSPEERGTLDEVIQLFENKRKRELYDICSLRRPEEEDIALMGRLIADEDQPVGINDPNGDGYTPLILLVRNNRNESLFQSIKTLFDSMRKLSDVTSADVVNKKDRRGNHVLNYMALNYRHSNLLDIVQLLCDKGLDLKGMDEKRSAEVLEFLCLGYSHPNLLGIIELLFNHGLNVKKEPSRRGFERPKTALEHLCGRYKHGNLEAIVQLLLANGVEADHSNCPDNPDCTIGKLLPKLKIV